MKRIALLTVLILGRAYAQQAINPGILQVQNPPTLNSPCTKGVEGQKDPNGVLWTCTGPFVGNMGTWTVASGGSSGSGTVANQANGVIPLATAPTAIGAQSHLDDGVTTSNTITASRAFTGNVNKVISVIAPPYNAKCDGVTDDQTAIQAAFTAALSGGQQIQFPAGHCLTSTITYKGQSFFGAGKGITFIQGQPGQDVFQVPDNNSFALQVGATIHDLNIVVNTSVNASATAGGGNNTYPNRIAGTVQNLTAISPAIVPGNVIFGTGNCTGSGASATATGTDVSIVCSGTNGYALALIDPALVTGAPITINGAGAAGGVYNGTITGINSGCTGSTACHIAVTPAISTTVTNAAGSMLNAQTPPWYIGNAGIAFQCSNGSACAGGASSYNFYNLEFDQTPTTYMTASHSAGIFTQAQMYACHYEKINFLHLYAGYVEAAPISGGIGTPDTSSFKDMDFFNSVIPMVTYNGNDRDLSNINFYAEYPLQAGPYYLTSSTGTAGWTVHSIYMEGNLEQSGEFARFMSGLGSMHVTGANLFGGPNSSPLGWVEWNSTGSSVSGILGNAIQVDGNSNDFRALQLPPGQIIDKGLNNTFSSPSQTGSNKYQGRKYNPSYTPPRAALGNLDASQLLSGNSLSPYYSISDLFTTCADWTFTYNPLINHNTFGNCVNDPTGTELSKKYFQSATATQIFALGSSSTVYQNMWAGSARTFGVSNTSANGGPSSIVPQTKVNVIITGECVGASTCTFKGHTKDGNTGGNITTSPTLTLNNTWTTQSFISDLSSTTSGDVLDLWLDTWSNAGTGYNIASIAIQPINDDEHNWLATNGLPVTAGTPGPTTMLKVVDTSGAGIVTGPTSATNLDMAVFDGTTGKIKDGGAPAAAYLTTVPAGLQFYGDGSEGALNITSGNNVVQTGEHWYSTCNVSVGALLAGFSATTVAPLVLRCSTSATIAGTLGYGPNTTGSSSNNTNGSFSASGGGGGGGTAAGTAGSGYQAASGGGTAGGSSGGAGGNGSTVLAPYQKMFTTGAYSPVAAAQCGGGQGGAGGSSGGAAGRGGGCIVIVSPSINFTGTIDVSGGVGTASAANSTGGGGAGGGGILILRSPILTNTGTVQISGGQGGNCFNPAIVLTAPTGTSQTNSATTWGSAHVSTFAGGNPTVITVDNAGTGYNFTPTCTVSGTGGGPNTGSGATCTVTMTGSAPNQTISSIAVSGGNAGYGTGTTYTPCGKGGDGAPGWVKTFNQ